MHIDTTITGHHAVLTLRGRLDINWADHLAAVGGEVIRGGHHHLRIDATGVEYISSAGLRALIRLHKELAAVRGTLLVSAASSFVDQALRMSGMAWLLAPAGDEAAPPPVESPAPPSVPLEGMTCEVIELDASARMTLQAPCRWIPWEPVGEDQLRKISFPRQTLGLGIGGPGSGPEDASAALGEFLAVEGCLTWLSAGGGGTPDYLLQTGELIPALHAIQALRAEGDFARLIRFRPAEPGGSITLSALADAAVRASGANAVVMACIAEVDGLVGAALARSPREITTQHEPGKFPAVRDWLSFCGERVHTRQTALIALVAARDPSPGLAQHLPPLPGDEHLRLHAHAAVFPYRPLPEGRIELAATVASLFASAEPVDLMHLIIDDRPLLGLGQSAFVRGACWCAPAHWPQEGVS